MSLIKSISGIRGTIGGAVTDGLNPVSTTQFTAAYASFIRKQAQKSRPLIIVGRDARISGSMVNRIVTGTLLGMGCDVIDIGLATTPTTEMAVIGKQADGGIILTASHNPKQWNALTITQRYKSDCRVMYWIKSLRFIPIFAQPASFSPKRSSSALELLREIQKGS